MEKSSQNLVGIGSALGASFFFTVNDATIKFLSGDYALHQIVMIRASIGLIFLLAVMVPLMGGFRQFRTQRLGLHILRGMCVVFANMAFFLGLSSLPIAEATALFFVSPLAITLFAVIFLKETVGLRRWAAIAVGLVGVVLIIRPGDESFQLAALLPVAAAFGYAALHTLTRKIGTTESALTMTLYIQLSFIVVSVAMGIMFSDGRFAPGDGSPMDFLLREWVVPPGTDYKFLVLLGLASTAGGFLISQAYRLCEAGLAAPFEYLALPLSIFWGVVVFGEWPDAWVWAGITLILGAGVYMGWREAVQGRPVVIRRPKRR